jgi:predicted HTH transcriptional regulator
MIYIQEKGKITRREALSIVHAGETKTKEILNSLLGQGFIKRTGKRRSTHYVLGEGND